MVLGKLLLEYKFPMFANSTHLDFKASRTLLGWTEDVVELADQLNIDKFVVVGLSGGVPHALACAYKPPHRLNGLRAVLTSL